MDCLARRVLSEGEGGEAKEVLRADWKERNRRHVSKALDEGKIETIKH